MYIHYNLHKHLGYMTCTVTWVDTGMFQVYGITLQCSEILHHTFLTRQYFIASTQGTCACKQAKL